MLIFALALIVDQQAYSGEIKERLSKPVVASFETDKPAYDLEICVADSLSDVLGTPTILRDGPTNTVLLFSMKGNATGYPASVSFIRRQSKTVLEVRFRGGELNDRMKERLKQCL